jgi:transcriptional regulator GlxA family with amidase domain
MPKFLRARPPLDDSEARKIRRLAGARHAPADWSERARIIALRWDGLTVPAIAARAGCHENTVRRWLHRFNAAGIDGLGDRPGAGRKRRITQRLALAPRLLETTDQPINHIAASAGFGTPAAMRLQFQQALDTSPAAYRRTFRTPSAA